MSTKNDAAADRRVSTLIRIYRAAVASGDQQLKHAASAELSRHGITAEIEIRTDPPSAADQDATAASLHRHIHSDQEGLGDE